MRLRTMKPRNHAAVADFRGYYIAPIARLPEEDSECPEFLGHSKRLLTKFR